MKVNPKYLKRVEVPKPTFGNQYGLENETFLKNPTPARKYIKLMAQCLDYQTPAELFPNTNHPMLHQLRDLCRLGFIDRFVLTKSNGKPGMNPYYYRTTPKGLNLVVWAYNRTYKSYKG